MIGVKTNREVMPGGQMVARASGMSSFEEGVVKKSTHVSDIGVRDSDGNLMLFDSPEGIPTSHVKEVDVEGVMKYANVSMQAFFAAKLGPDGSVSSVRATLITDFATWYGIIVCPPDRAFIAGNQVSDQSSRFLTLSGKSPRWTVKEMRDGAEVEVVRREEGMAKVCSLDMVALADILQEAWKYALPIDHAGMGIPYEPYTPSAVAEGQAQEAAVEPSTGTAEEGSDEAQPSGVSEMHESHTEPTRSVEEAHVKGK